MLIALHVVEVSWQMRCELVLFSTDEERADIFYENNFLVTSYLFTTINAIITICIITSGELPETESYEVIEKAYEVKTCAVIQSLDVESDPKPSVGFKKRRAKNLRKKQKTDD